MEWSLSVALSPLRKKHKIFQEKVIVTKGTDANYAYACPVAGAD